MHQKNGAWALGKVVKTGPALLQALALGAKNADARQGFDGANAGDRGGAGLAGRFNGAALGVGGGKAQLVIIPPGQGAGINAAAGHGAPFVPFTWYLGTEGLVLKSNSPFGNNINSIPRSLKIIGSASL